MSKEQPKSETEKQNGITSAESQKLSRPEWVKSSFEIDGIIVYDFGQEYVFVAKNEKGDDVEHHMSKKNPFPVENQNRAADVDIDLALKAAVNFPNIPLKEALKKLNEAENGKETK